MTHDKAGETLKLSEEVYREIFNATSEAIFVHDAKTGTIIDVNRAFEEMFGYTRAEIHTLNVEALSSGEPPYAQEQALAFIRKATQDGPQLFEWRSRRKNQECFWSEVTLQATAIGGEGRVLAVVRDITTRKQTEEALRRECQFNASLIQTSSAFFVALTPKGKIKLMNRAMLDALGYPENEVLGRDYLSMLIPQEEQQSVSDAFQCVLKEGHVSSENHVLTKQGKEILVEWRGCSIVEQAGEVQFFFGVGIDITERRRAQETLRKSEERLRLALKGTNTGLHEWYPQSNDTYFSPTWFTMLGYEPDEFPHNYQTWFNLLWPDDRAKAESVLQDFIRERRESFTMELRMRTKKGGYRWIFDQGAAVEWDESGNITRVVGTHSDITARKRMEMVQAARWRLIEYAATHSVKELLQRFLDEAEAITSSEIGFYHFLEEDQETVALQAWSTNTLENMCKAQGAGRHYPIAEAGVWVDCVRQRRPVIHNDYASLPHKQGLPEGHAPVVRELVVPVLRKNRIVAILGVGNKPFDYYSQDVEAVQQLADLAWETVERKRSAESLRSSEDKFSKAFHSSPDTIAITRLRDGKLLEINEGFERMFGISREEVIGKTSLEMGFWADPTDRADMVARFEAGRGLRNIEYRFRKRSGETLIGLYSGERIEIGGEACLLSVVRDITDQKQAQKKIQKAFTEIQKLKEQLEAENVYLREEIRMAHLHGDIISQSDAMKAVMAQAEQVAPTDSTVLILGETGTGKELLARAIHNMSGRSARPLVTVNCAAIPATLVESELFGREKGAYTGAVTRQIGHFEVANGSTVFLDEIGELPAEAQAKLLRVLQEGQIQRLGSTKTISADVRVIAATNRDLAKDVEQGRFRQDLYYRLNVFPITIPALRDRPEDIPLLVWTFVSEFVEKMGKRVDDISRKNMATLEQYAWPGNIRELRNTIERAMILTRGSTLQLPALGQTPDATAKSQALTDVEREHILAVLKQTRWRVRGKSGAAEILGLKPSTLETRMAKLGIRRPTIEG